MSILDSTALYVSFFAVVLLSVVGAAIITIFAPTSIQIFTNPVALHNYNYIISWIYKLDAVFVFLVLGGLAAILYRAHAIAADFADFAAGFVASVLILILSMYLSNIFTNVLQQSAFAQGIGPFSLSIYVISNWPIYQGIESLIYLIVILTKLRTGSINAPTRDGIYGG
jgi:hypothetical protein